jgi:hypothetical protein
MARAIRLTGIVMLALSFIATRADAQVKTLIMPGEVIEGHAELEANCDNCHAAFDRSKQRALCLDCHENIAFDIDNMSGYHGLFEDARSETCANCHTDHDGRDAVIVILNRQQFDHDFTDFALIGHHTDADCNKCHAPDTKFRDAESGCYSCHVEDNVHEESLGTECGDCHSPTGWLDVDFDHDTTDFPLIGLHRDVECESCHEDQTFQDTPTTCFDCHAEDDVHEGRSGQQCENCHSPTGWDDTSFNHERDTRFALDGTHAELACGDCHSDDPFGDQLDMACVSCHLEDDNHDGHLGGKCETCHNSTDWADILFDHNTDTDYEIHGAHETLECVACHIEPVYDVALQSGCNSCHAEDDPHFGTQGAECQECHNETDWALDVFFDHDLTRFPLLGKHREPECDSCHETHVFEDAPENCVDCHREDDPHDGRFEDDCASCHNPVDWQQWQFDHDLQTSFPLEGAHTTVGCNNCHRQPRAAMSRLGGRCGDCHRADDIHDGEFGPDCGRCHSADNFRDVRSIQ